MTIIQMENNNQDGTLLETQPHVEATETQFFDTKNLVDKHMTTTTKQMYKTKDALRQLQARAATENTNNNNTDKRKLQQQKPKTKQSWKITNTVKSLSRNTKEPQPRLPQHSMQQIQSKYMPSEHCLKMC